MPLSDLALYAVMGIAFVGAFASQGLLLAAREHVRRNHPAWFEELGAGGSRLRLGGPADRARRRLIRPLLFGPLPPEVAADAQLAQLAQRLKVAMLSVALGFGAMVAMIAIRVQLAGAA